MSFSSAAALPIQLQPPQLRSQDEEFIASLGVRVCVCVHLGVGESFNCFLQLELLVSVAGLQLRSCIS